MIEISNIQVFNFDGAFRGLRNPMNSWDKSDSYFGILEDTQIGGYIDKIAQHYANSEKHHLSYDFALDFLSENGDNTALPASDDRRFRTIALIGPEDLNLAQRMIKGGPDEAKFMRQIFISVDIEAPLYWWKEKDTYKVATVANSCSTMHKLASTPITPEMFSFDNGADSDPELRGIMQSRVEDIEWIRQLYLKTKEERYFRALIQLLPDGWNQKRTWTGNYQTLRAEYNRRRNHKQAEWRELCKLLEKLPYADSLICF